MYWDIQIKVLTEIPEQNRCEATSPSTDFMILKIFKEPVPRGLNP